MNTLTYILQLTDKMSSTLNRIGGNTNSTTREVKQLKSEVNSLNNVSLGGFYSSISKIATTLGVGALLGKTIKSGMEQEMRNTSFEVLFGGVDNAKKMIDNVSDYAAKSPYGKVGISEAVQTMAGFGIAQNKIMPNLKAIGDIAMGNEQKFQSLSLAFSQMSSTGKLTGQDLLQMINAGFNPLNQISKTTGKSVGILKQEMEKGKISSDMVTAAFQQATQKGGLYYNMIDRINDTTSGQWSMAMDSISEKLLNLYDNVLQPIILPALKKFNKFLDDPIGTIGRLVDKITTDFPVITTIFLVATGAVVGYKLAVLSMAGLQMVIAGIKSALIAFEIVVFAIKNSTNLWTAAQWLLNVALGANPVGLIVAGVVALIALIAFLIIKVDGWGAAWHHTVNGSKLIFFSYVEFVKSNFNTMIQTLMIGINKIKEGWYKFKEAVGMGDSSENQKMLAQIQADTEARKKSILDGYKKTAELAKQGTLEFKAAGGSLKWNNTTFADVAKGLKNKLGISAPTIPGADAPLGDDKTNKGGKGGKAGKDTAKSIATGGTKTTHITVNVAGMGNDMKIYVSSVKEGAENMRDVILDELTRVLSMAQGQI